MTIQTYLTRANSSVWQATRCRKWSLAHKHAERERERESRKRIALMIASKTTRPLSWRIREWMTEWMSERMNEWMNQRCRTFVLNSHALKISHLAKQLNFPNNFNRDSKACRVRLNDIPNAEISLYFRQREYRRERKRENRSSSSQLYLTVINR